MTGRTDLKNKRILVVKQSSLGDVVHTLPVVHAIKRTEPTVFIGWVVQKGLKNLLTGDPAIDEIIIIDIPSTSDPKADWRAIPQSALSTVLHLKKLRERFRRNPYHFVLDLHASFKSGLISFINPRAIRIGFADAKELNTWFQNITLNVPDSVTHAVDKNLLFLKHLGIRPESQDFKFCVNNNARNNISGILEKARKGGAKIIYANPATRWVSKHWIPENWTILADRLIEELNCALCFGGSREDLDYISRITTNMKSEPFVVAGKLGLQEAVALIEASDLYVGVDSGPMHIAAFSGTPVIAIFGPTDPDKVGPYGSGHEVIRADLSCLACRKRSCTDHSCMAQITPDVVFEKVRYRLSSPSV